VRRRGRGWPHAPVRPRVRLRPVDVAAGHPRVRARPPGRPLRPRRRRWLGPLGLEPHAVRLAGGVRPRRPGDLRGARPARRRVRRALGERDDRRPGRRTGAGPFRRTGPRRAVAPLRGRPAVPGRLRGGGHRGAPRVAGQQLSGLVGGHGAGDRRQSRPSRARRGADQQLLPHGPLDRPPLRPGHLHLRQPRRPRPRRRAVPGPAVPRGRHRPARGGRVRALPNPRQHPGRPRRHGPLSEPQRAGPGRRGDPGLAPGSRGRV
ncbi:MAG: Hydrolase of unknown specificity RsbQ, part of a novel [RsbQ - PAS domain] bacterial sensing module, partial [uncultured Actinomycetospora sp.]